MSDSRESRPQVVEAVDLPGATNNRALLIPADADRGASAPPVLSAFPSTPHQHHPAEVVSAEETSTGWIPSAAPAAAPLALAAPLAPARRPQEPPACDSGRSLPAHRLPSLAPQQQQPMPSPFPPSPDDDSRFRVAQELWRLDGFGKADLSFGASSSSYSLWCRTAPPPRSASGAPPWGPVRPVAVRPLLAGAVAGAGAAAASRKRPYPDSAVQPPEAADLGEAMVVPEAEVPPPLPLPCGIKRRRQVSDGDRDDGHSVDAGRPCSVVQFHRFCGSLDAPPAAPPRGWDPDMRSSSDDDASDDDSSDGFASHSSDDDDDDDGESDSYDDSTSDDDDTSYVSELTEPNYFAALTAREWPPPGIGSEQDDEDDGDDSYGGGVGGGPGGGRGASDLALRVFTVVSTVVIAVDAAWSTLSGAFRSSKPPPPKP